MENVAIRVRWIDLIQVFGHGLARDGQTVAVKKSGIQERSHDDGYAADAIHITHHVATERLDVGQKRDLGADPMEIFHIQLHVRLVRDSEEVQHGIGGTAEGHQHCDGVLQGLTRDDVARRDALSDEFDNSLTRTA